MESGEERYTNDMPRWEIRNRLTSAYQRKPKRWTKSKTKDEVTAFIAVAIRVASHAAPVPKDNSYLSQMHDRTPELSTPQRGDGWERLIVRHRGTRPDETDNPSDDGPAEPEVTACNTRRALAVARGGDRPREEIECGENAADPSANDAAGVVCSGASLNDDNGGARRRV